jgi:hypothetical protein
MHQGITPNIELLHIGSSMAVAQPSGESLAKCGVAFGLAQNEVLIAKIGPFDLIPCTQRVILGEDNKHPFDPKRESLTTLGIGRIHDERHIKVSFSNSCDVVCRWTFQNLDIDIRVM